MYIYATEMGQQGDANTIPLTGDFGTCDVHLPTSFYACLFAWAFLGVA